VSSVDLNADLAEGFGIWTLGDDDAMLDIVTSANLACGFHAGNPVGLARTCRAAAARGVRIGAQVGYFDLAGFGRRRIEVAPEELSADVIYQIGALQALARAAGTTLGYVKPHGALYNTIVTDSDQARAVAEAVHASDPPCRCSVWPVRCSSPRLGGWVCGPSPRLSPTVPINPTDNSYPEVMQVRF
jgi:UPF0271 protein